jgi:hypothetical protein
VSGRDRMRTEDGRGTNIGERQEDGRGTDEDHTGGGERAQRGGQHNLDGLKDVQLTTLRRSMARHAKINWNRINSMHYPQGLS